VFGEKNPTRPKKREQHSIPPCVSDIMLKAVVVTTIIVLIRIIKVFKPVRDFRIITIRSGDAVY
jgi:hypothetical protein